MDLTPIVDGMNRMAKSNRPETDTDWRDSNGLLHCGKCGEKIEHLIWNNQRPNIDLSKFDFEQRQRAEQTINMLKGKRVRCICRCDEIERQKFEKIQYDNQKREMRFFAFGNSMHLSNITLDKDNGKNSKISIAMNRYVKKFSEIKDNGTCIILSGDHNTGKTFFSIAIANALIDKGYCVSYSSIYKIHSKTSPYITVQHIINAEACADLIIIEDVNEDCMEGKNYHTLINYIGTMQSQNKPIIITTMLVGEALNQLKQICKKSSIIDMGQNDANG
jgi:DNA replication protein DnaC